MQPAKYARITSCGDMSKNVRLLCWLVNQTKKDVKQAFDLGNVFQSSVGLSMFVCIPQASALLMLSPLTTSSKEQMPPLRQSTQMLALAMWRSTALMSAR